MPYGYEIIEKEEKGQGAGVISPCLFVEQLGKNTF
jgi:hypothetical protein